MNEFNWQWHTADGEPRGIIVICHGMAEHHQRYHDFARFLTTHGWHVLTYDHPGHGAQAKTLGYFGPSGWNAMTDRLTVMLAHATQEAPDLPVWILGHSMGSFLVLDYATTMPLPEQCRGIVLIGTDSPALGPTWALSLVSRLVRKRFGPKHVSPLMHRLTFGAFNRSVSEPRTDFDWICNNPEVVDRYIEDSLCGFGCSVDLWCELSQVLLRLRRNKTLARLPTQCETLILSGGRDPVGRFGKGPRELTSRLRRFGPGAELKLYPTLRHEILNESDKQVVWTDVQRMVSDFTPH